MAEKKIYEQPKFEVVEPDEGNGANTRLPYGIAKGLGLSTEGMTPRQVWEMLKKRGINPENEYEKLKEKATEEIESEPVKEVDAQREGHKMTITQSKAFATLSKTAKEKLERNLDKLSSEQIAIISKYADRLHSYSNGSGQYSTGGGYLRYDQTSNGDGLDKELGFDFDATTFFHEYGHFIDNMVGEDKTGYSIKYDSSTVSVHEDALNCFNDFLKLGGGTEPLKSMDRIKREQYRAFYKGLAKATEKDQLWAHKSLTEFGYVKEPYKPSYTPERARQLFGEYGYENSVKLWDSYNKDYKAWQQAESDGTNARAKQKQKEYNEELEKHNRPIHNNIKRCAILTDFFGLYTNNKINLYSDGYYGHSGSYNKWHNAQGEAWAEYFSLKMTNDTKGLDIMKKYLPKTYDAFEQKYNAIKEK